MIQKTPCEADPDKWHIDGDGRRADEEEPPEGDDLKVAMRDRRHARDACFVECPVRLRCLALALENNETQGTWGGYHAEQRRAIVRAQQERLDRA